MFPFTKMFLSAVNRSRQTEWGCKYSKITRKQDTNLQSGKKEQLDKFKPMNPEEILTGFTVCSILIANLSTSRCASPNWVKASLAFAWGSRTPMPANTSPKAAVEQACRQSQLHQIVKAFSSKNFFRYATLIYKSNIQPTVQSFMECILIT